MQVLDGILTIDSNLDNEQLVALSKEIEINLETIKEIQIDAEVAPASSALFSLLTSVKKAKKEIFIPVLEQDTTNIAGLGDVRFITKG